MLLEPFRAEQLGADRPLLIPRHYPRFHIDPLEDKSVMAALSKYTLDVQRKG